MSRPVFPHLTIANRANGWHAEVQVATRPQGFDLFDEALFNHLPETSLDALVQDVALRGSDTQLRDSIRQDAGAWRVWAGFLRPCRARCSLMVKPLTR